MRRSFISMSQRELFGSDARPIQDATVFAVALLRAECEFLVGHLTFAEEQLLVLSQSCANLQTSSDVARLRAQLYTSNGQVERAVDVCLEFLRQVGINWPPSPIARRSRKRSHPTSILG